jgi:hypothetical protein
MIVLRIRLSILGYENGVLLYMVVGSNVKNYFPEYHLKMTQQDRQRMLEKIERSVDELQFAVDNHNPNLAKAVVDNVDYINKSGDHWFCNSCPYKHSCTAYQEANSNSNTDDELLCRLDKQSNSSKPASEEREDGN